MKTKDQLSYEQVLYDQHRRLRYAADAVTFSSAYLLIKKLERALREDKG